MTVVERVLEHGTSAHGALTCAVMLSLVLDPDRQEWRVEVAVDAAEPPVRVSIAGKGGGAEAIAACADAPAGALAASSPGGISSTPAGAIATRAASSSAGYRAGRSEHPDVGGGAGPAAGRGSGHTRERAGAVSTASDA